ncbi:MAG: glycosyltransferase [Candidatus Kuenenia sp.]|nr:glycosyltransferase [Candidatus Kuenenia hertensis]
MAISKNDGVREKVKNIISKFGIEINRLDRRFITLKPERECRGNVLLSYIIDPFLLKEGESVSNNHTNHWESLQMAKTFLDLGYCVDAIHYGNKTFIPRKNYTIFIAARTNFQRIAQLLNEECVKIVHLDTAHWLFNSTAEHKRCLDLQKRRGVTLASFRPVEPNLAIEYADCATILGNDFAIGTYSYAQKPMFRVPLATCTAYPWPEDKNYQTCRNHFLWIGSYGLVHKGLDLVLEAFAKMPEYQLTVCGPIQKEKAFEKAFSKELYHTPNIHTICWVDVTSSEFVEVTNKCVGVIYPSCSESGGGSVVTCMQAGLIPVVSYESSVDVHDFGMILKDCSIDEIRNSIIKISSLPAEKLKSMARKAWEFARTNHTRERFAEEYKKVIEKIINTYGH